MLYVAINNRYYYRKPCKGFPNRGCSYCYRMRKILYAYIDVGVGLSVALYADLTNANVFCNKQCAIAYINS